MHQKKMSPVRLAAGDAIPSPIGEAMAGTILGDRVVKGLKAGEFHVAFQPIVHAQTGTLSGVECLLRWSHPDYGVLLPGSFRHVFDNVDVAREISYFVLESVCEQLAGLRKLGIDTPPHVAINIQPSQLVDDTLSERIRKITKKHGVDPCVLELELIETEDVAKILAVHEFTRSLRKLGVRLAIDDFGTGYSSLTTLDRMHIDTVKLTREFLLGIPASPLACTVVSTILDLFARLGITAVAEGVETSEQLRWLAQRPEVLVQGYYIAPPRQTLSEALRDHRPLAKGLAVRPRGKHLAG